MKRLRVYADTSVFGGCFDDEFSEDSRKFFEEIKMGKFQLVVSEMVVFEIQRAPAEVKSMLTQIPPESVEMVETAEEITALRDAYVAAGVRR